MVPDQKIGAIRTIGIIEAIETIKLRMLIVKPVLIFSVGLIGLLGLSAFAEMTMTNVQIQNCAKHGDACMTVKSPLAHVSGIGAIFYMKNVEIEIRVPGSAEPAEKFQRQSGVLDFDSNQLVLNSTDVSGTFIEEVYDLKTLRKQIYKTR